MEELVCPDCEGNINNITGTIGVYVQWSANVTNFHIICKNCAKKYPRKQGSYFVRLSKYEWLRIKDKV